MWCAKIKCAAGVLDVLVHAYVRWCCRATGLCVLLDAARGGAGICWGTQPVSKMMAATLV